MARSRVGIALGLGLAGTVLAADQAGKWVVRHQAGHLPWHLTGGLRIELNYNAGISFSQFAGASWVMALVAAVCAGVAIALWFAPPAYRPALGIILGGALGNLVDRLVWDGAVIDFLGVYTWPTFNLADVAIVGGTMLLALRVLRGADH